MALGDDPRSKAWLFIASNVAQSLAMHPTATHNQKWAAKMAANIADALMVEYLRRCLYWENQSTRDTTMHDASVHVDSHSFDDSDEEIG